MIDRLFARACRARVHLLLIAGTALCPTMLRAQAPVETLIGRVGATDAQGMPAIELVSGEAVLSSAGNGRAALIAGAGTSVVSGGRFNARRDGDKVCVTCLAGKVEVTWARERRVLGPADEVRYAASGIGAVVRGTDPAVLTAWQSGTLIFRGMPLRQVVAEINRYRSGRVFLTNSALGARPLSGTYYVDRLDDFFSQAELALGVNVARYPGNIVVLS